ncbi:MAG: hypothetical protein M3R57_10965 [Chloroflexota bacterium]|nr:hypothetical protein [Chloroflexota bacterium]
MGPRPEESIHGGAAIASALETVDRIVGADARRVFGWATVELDRAERDLVASFGRLSLAWSRDLADDTLLGARCRLIASRPGLLEILLLEPVTEGRIAASLARFDEGAVVVYVLVPTARLRDVLRDLRAAGLVLSGEGGGPFGREWLVTGSPRWGAHLCVAESAEERAPVAGAATIGS